jgi:hypothetical protein
MEPDRPQGDHLAACVIAQQYSPATFVSLRFHFRKEKFGARFKCVTMSFFTRFTSSTYDISLLEIA